ncbi:MAG: DUF4082 domain-containing protein [Candidatus Moranbacteria bacterium]|nr:DUF4082 domain-containing protein [Candidatus Moranbacteria bacterium]
MTTYSLWDASYAQSAGFIADGAVELGVKFSSDVDGFITGIRFHKNASATGVHTGSLWTNAGSLLATVTFTGETASNWQQMLFASPVAITAGTVYVASYYAASGGYSYEVPYFTAARDSGPLHALQNGGAAGGNGVFRYGGGGVFPTGTFNSGNYWVDVLFEPAVSDITVALTGQAMTAAQGSLAPTAAIPLSGQALSAATGNLQPSLALTLTGHAMTLAQGSLIADISRLLSGQGLTVAAGALAVSLTINLSGLSLTLALGYLGTGLMPDSIDWLIVEQSANTLIVAGGATTLIINTAG